MYRAKGEASLPLHSDLRVTTTADRSRLRRRVPAVAVARIRVQRQYVAAVDVADDRRQHRGEAAGSPSLRADDGRTSLTTISRR